MTFLKSLDFYRIFIAKFSLWNDDYICMTGLVGEHGILRENNLMETSVMEIK